MPIFIDFNVRRTRCTPSVAWAALGDYPGRCQDGKIHTANVGDSILSLSSMATISTFQHENPQGVFDLLEHHLSLKEDSLVSLTHAFHNGFKNGLANYNQRPAMM